MVDQGKRAAGEAAIAEVRDGMVIGLGTGTTVAYFLQALAEAGLDIRGVPTSDATARTAHQLGIELVSPEDVSRLDLTVDGADELTTDLNLVKGGGGALLREKVVATMSDHLVIIATPDKVVERLASSFPLPVEVIPFASAPVEGTLVERGYEVTAREDRTDNGNVILDARHHTGLSDPATEAAALSAVPGVAEHGLFIGLTTVALLGNDDGRVTRLQPPNTSPSHVPSGV